jgi:hypothetical protein
MLKYNNLEEQPLDFTIEEDSEEEIGFYNMKLNKKCFSDKSLEMIEALTQELYEQAGIQKRPTRRAYKATAAIVGDLLKGRSYKPPKPCGRYMSPNTFEHCHVGFKSFTGIKEKMEQAGFITVEKGIWGRIAEDGVGKITTMQITPKLLEYALNYGVTPNNRSMHFVKLPRPKAIFNPVRVTKKRLWIDGKKKQKAYIRFDPCDTRLLQECIRVNRLNHFWADQVITPDNHYAFYRIFSNGDVEGFNFNRGGRIISEGGGYQNQSPENRLKTRINGHPVCELDIVSCHTRIYCGVMGQPLAPDFDPYADTGFPRNVAKAYVAMLMGRKTTSGDWAEQTKEGVLKKQKLDLNQYAVDDVREAVFKVLPLLRKWDNSPYWWDDLQYIESCIILETIEELAYRHNVPALPVHDSIILPVKDQELAKEVLSRCFHKHTGAVPMLSLK